MESGVDARKETLEKLIKVSAHGECLTPQMRSRVSKIVLLMHMTFLHCQS